MGVARVRMYNVGFGDCFLLTLPNDRRMLIDCGTHPIAPARPSLATIVPRVIADATDDGRRRIDVIVATHRHADHIAGFAHDAWDGVDVGETWMPWTEDPDDRDATDIRAKQEGLATRLAVSTNDAVLALAANAQPQSHALRRLVRGFRSVERRRFVAAGEHIPGSRSALGDGVDVLILGPSRDVDVVRDMTPPPDQRYAAERLARDAVRPPFGEKWFVCDPPRAGILSGPDIATLRSVRDEDDVAAAVRLDAAINGTSIVFALSVGDAVLLFPGDAQWGSWKHALANPTAHDLLQRASFYKVSHHGSHNGTPVALVEAAGALTMAALSTRSGLFGWDIPREPLLAELGKRNVRVGRIDRGYTPRGFVRDPNNLFMDAMVTT